MELYLQLTEKCNMSCAHCCFAATGKGTFMTESVFNKSLDIAKSYGGGITMGGGEPTLHPKILDWVMDAALATLDASMEQECPVVLVVTNGKKTETALKLAKLGHLGVICAELSQDPWHDEIDEKVVSEFTRYNKHRWERKRGNSGIRNVEGGIKGQGRALENGLGDVSGCACEALFVKPNGDFYPCGCAKTKLGNILTDKIPEFLFNHLGECEDDISELQKDEELVAA